VSWLRLPSNILHDQKKISSFPISVAHGHHLLPTFTVVGLTAGLIAADQPDARYFRRTTTFQSFNRAFSGHNTSLVIALAPMSLYAIGWVHKDSYQQKTALLAGEAVADSLILSTVLKVATLRLRPSDILPQGDFSDSFFLRRNAISSGSFPSGHTIAAFSIATIFAERYSKHHRWVPWVAYATAATIGFSRITLQAHFPSDVFLGAALGYSVSRFAVLGGP
jgi:PAP2 superfamily